MSDELQEANHEPQMVYQIRLRGHMGGQWATWFEGAAIALQESGDTLLTCEADQAALHRLLRKVRDLGLTLLSVSILEAGAAEGSSGEQPL